jgi:hypothetical protein
MFGVQLRKMAQGSGLAARGARHGADNDLSGVAVVVVNLGDRVDWLPLIEQASRAGVSVVAFGPHIDAEARKRAKAAGASRVLANSNLTRDLPGMLEEAMRDA